MSTLKRKIAMSDNKTFAAIKRLKAMRVVVPSKRFMSRNSKTSAVVKGVVVSGPMGPERKKFDSNQSTTTVSTAAPFVLSLLNGINEGTATNQRVGQRIHVKGLDLNLQTFAGTTAATAGGVPEFLDCMLIWDKQPNEATASAGSIFQSAATNLTFLNTQNLERFQVLKRERINFDSASAISFVTGWHQSLEMAARFSDSAGTSPNTNDLLFVCLSNAANVASNIPSFQFNWRVTFTDE